MPYELTVAWERAIATGRRAVAEQTTDDAFRDTGFVTALIQLRHSIVTYSATSNPGLSDLGAYVLQVIEAMPAVPPYMSNDDWQLYTTLVELNLEEVEFGRLVRLARSLPTGTGSLSPLQWQNRAAYHARSSIPADARV